jgi:hypothetical protein
MCTATYAKKYSFTFTKTLTLCRAYWAFQLPHLCSNGNSPSVLFPPVQTLDGKTQTVAVRQQALRDLLLQLIHIPRRIHITAVQVLGLWRRGPNGKSARQVRWRLLVLIVTTSWRESTHDHRTRTLHAPEYHLRRVYHAKVEVDDLHIVRRNTIRNHRHSQRARALRERVRGSRGDNGMVAVVYHRGGDGYERLRGTLA